ncbi:MAG TPA: ABC transporter permease, partial [Acidimicrobiia bacterium]|nr:ABC transporter permease [Acidimicrobiia bacterium]
MPEQPADTGVAERDLATDAAVKGRPVDAGLETPIDAAEAGAEGVAKKRLGFGAWLAAGWLVLLLLLMVLAPLLPIGGPRERFSGLAFQQPLCTASDCVSGHPLGGDSLGRDMTARLVYGARNSMFVGVGSVTIGILVGGFLGLVAGYYRGRLESFIVGLLDTLLSVPALILALSLAIFLRERVQSGFGVPFTDLPLTPALERETAGRMTLTLALGIIAIPSIGRITRANTLVWSQREFVTAARAQGAKDFRIMFREVLPNVVPAMAAIALLALGVIIIAEAALSILGAGIGAPAPTWGNIIVEGFDFLTNGKAPHIVFTASAAIFLTVLSINYLGDAVRQRFDVREARL